MKNDVASFVDLALASSMSYLALRGNDVHVRTEGDLDYLVPKGKAVKACYLLAKVAREKGWFVLLFRDIGYLASVVLVNPSSGGDVFSIKVDFFSGLEWYDAGDGTINDLFFQNVIAGVKIEDERSSIAAAINFLQKCMTVGRLSQRDLSRVKSGGASPDFVLKIAQSLNLPLSEKDATTGQLSRFAIWRLRAASAAPQNLLAWIGWFFRVLVAHLRFKTKTGFHSGLILTLSGLDGSGKSSQLERLLKAYTKAGLMPPQTIHLLPQWIPLPHQIIRRKTTVQNYLRPYAEPPVASSVSAILRLTYYILAFFAAKVALQLSVLRGEVIILDRCFADFASDLSRARIPHRMLSPFTLRFCSPDGCLIFIDARPETVVSRKGELKLDKARELQKKYHYIFAVLNGRVINGEGSQDDVFASILSCVDAIYFGRLSQYAAQ